eukprot:TRINITY_DN11335_c2_g1_i1.p1 TRINITY_DN11335_c2_g1~~TRINITY_DN11335_c2_g1_i1.p1  ORF type:complete len:239 (+),score=95.73 TRINITY_DN11335_c2_g1_i1:56-718(+)
MTEVSCKVAVLLSGSGSTLQNIFNHIDNGCMTGVAVELVVSSRSDAYGLERAKQRQVPTMVVESKRFRDAETKVTDWKAMSDEIHEVLKKYNIDLVILAGYMCMFIVPPELENKVMNVHPALIPAFSGQGMYGDRVHKAVVARGAKVTGCTVHFVTNEYDAGPIILQKTMPVTSAMTWEEVQNGVQNLERQAYPEAIFLYAAGRLTVKDGIVSIADAPPR